MDSGEMDDTKNKREKMARSTVPGHTLVKRVTLYSSKAFFSK